MQPQIQQVAVENGALVVDGQTLPGINVTDLGDTYALKLMDTGLELAAPLEEIERWVPFALGIRSLVTGTTATTAGEPPSGFRDQFSGGGS